MSDLEATESGVRATIESCARALSDDDRAGMLAHHSLDMQMFDFPATARGLGAYDETWDFFFANPRGPTQLRTASEIMVTADDDVAFASCEMHCDGTSAGPVDFRLTTGLRRINGEWVIVHEHHSVPTDHSSLIAPQ